MKDVTGERDVFLKALERVEAIFGVLAGDLPKGGLLPEFFRKDCLLREDMAALSLRLNTLADKAQEQQSETKQLRLELAGAEQETAQEREAKNSLETTLEGMRLQNAELFSSRELLQKKTRDMLQLLVSFRDRQLLRLGMARQEGDEALQRLFASLCKESLQMLEQLGVAEMPGVGAFDSEIHVVTETRETPDASLKDTIAEVYRPGYFLEGNVLRPQEVILYKYEAASEE